jgi:hypothetical protein
VHTELRRSREPVFEAVRCALFFTNFVLSTMDPFSSDGYDPPYNAHAHISHHERPFLQYPQAPDPQSLSPRSRSAITSASHEVLMRLGNVAYTSLNAQHIQAKSDLQAQGCVVSFSSAYMSTYFPLGILLYSSKM